MNKDFYTTFEAAKILGVSPGAVLNWIKSGKVTASRTVGGHFRIRGEHLEKMLGERNLIQPATEPPVPSETFQYCWEFNARDGQLSEDCWNCLVYRTRAKRCYEMNPVPKELGHLKVYCESVCEECDYFKHVQD